MSRPRPQILDDVAARGVRGVGNRNRNQNRVVKLPCDWNEVRHQVERHQQIWDEQSERHLRSARNAIVTQQALEEHDAIGEKARDFTSIATAPK